MTIAPDATTLRRPAMAEATCDHCAARELAICSSLQPDQLLRLRAVATTCRIEAGGQLCREGDPAHHLSSIIDGAVRLSKLLPDGRRQITGFLMRGDFLGLVFHDVHAVSAEALTPVRLCRYQRPQIERLMRELPELQRRLLVEANHDLVLAQEQMLLLGRKTARERVASFLVRLADRACRRGLPADPLGLPMSRADIADFLGLTTETVSRTFTQLKRAGLIALPGQGKVKLLRRDVLAEIAEGN